MGTLYRQRRAGAAVLQGNGGVLPGLSDKTNGLPTDDMSMREDAWTKFSPASPGWGLRGRKRRLLRNPQNSSGAKVATGARNAAPHTRRSWGLRACREVNVQSLGAAVASFRFQAGELAFLFSFLSFLLPGCGSLFLRRAFSFCLNRCLRRSGRKRAASEMGRLALCAVWGCDASPGIDRYRKPKRPRRGGIRAHLREQEGTRRVPRLRVAHRTRFERREHDRPRGAQ